ncbi:MAG: ATP-binding protein [Lachnospiraceae bacterium]|nr:ATP-binding protein [Lachnospiraceae bacterium]
MMAGKKRIGIGVENYKVLMDKNYYYVDKTLLVKEFLEKGAMVNLFIRPRRFGKTLALSMLRTFFEADTDAKGNLTDNSHYFAGKQIMEAGDEYIRHMGRYPVISLSLKSAKQPEYRMAYSCLVDEICREYERHRYVVAEDALIDIHKEKYMQIMNRRAEPEEYATALKFLSECLRQYHGKNTVILIDEYDVPLENAWFEGFYDQMIKFIRSVFESALKTNDCLEFAIVTGCLRISRESIFTGLNNLKVVSVLNDNFAEYFGFVQEEVKALLQYYGAAGKMEEAKQWYDGYLFGTAEVYNPWSILNYVDDAISQSVFFPKPYWSNTSSNSIVRELVEKADGEAKQEIETLIEGGTIEKPVHEDVTYGDIHKSQDNLWNFLFFTGYLKAIGQRLDGEDIYLTMKIPNKEVRYIYRSTIREWFEQKLRVADFTSFYRAVVTGDSYTFEETVKYYLRGSISYMDSAERFYHGFLLGLLSALQDYEMVSNRESGDGRPDIMLKPYDENEPVVIIEIKRTTKFNLMETECESALAQIEEKNYTAEPLDEGYTRILKYGICFCKKSCKVKCREIGM